MNNKGFAITTILYGTLILFLMLFLSMLGILSSYKDRINMLKFYENNNLWNEFSKDCFFMHILFVKNVKIIDKWGEE